MCFYSGFGQNGYIKKILHITDMVRTLSTLLAKI